MDLSIAATTRPLRRKDVITIQPAPRPVFPATAAARQVITTHNDPSVRTTDERAAATGRLHVWHRGSGRGRDSYSEAVRRGKYSASPRDLDVIRRALESADVEFIDKNGGGPGVRLQKRQQR
jgi:hypothetical protein